ncbi:hypothetical protein, partial [Propionibacterium freudenreichii]|uniref:hypothetical protein n=1 Tax=Propionibacterium freudenreichii TaxID=1744 RepID=UPI00255065F9
LIDPDTTDITATWFFDMPEPVTYVPTQVSPITCHLCADPTHGNDAAQLPTESMFHAWTTTSAVPRPQPHRATATPSCKAHHADRETAHHPRHFAEILQWLTETCVS